MALNHVGPGDVVNLLSVGDASTAAKTIAPAKTDAFEAIRLVVPKGHELPEHKAKGAITFQCLGGRIAFTARGATRELVVGDWLFLESQEPHSLKGLEDSSALLTVIF